MESNQYIRIEGVVLFFPNNSVQTVTENPNMDVLDNGFYYNITSDFPFNFHFFLVISIGKIKVHSNYKSSVNIKDMVFLLLWKLKTIYG